MLNNADPNIVPTGAYEETTMICAGYKGNLSMIKLLLNVENKYKYSFDWVCNCLICFM